ncbi:MAG: hypothetical protein MJ175_11495 [Clostridia bacterium]|nr:hypothetical protein [Clostridia bacterium]
MKTTKFQTALLLSAILLSVTACGAESGGSNTDVQAPAGTSAVSETEETHPRITFGGEDIMFLTEESAYSQYSSIEIYAETLDGSLINDTVFNRNTKIEDYYDVHIKQTRLQNASKMAFDTILAGDAVYDVVMPYLNASVKNAQEGLYLNLLDISDLHLDNSWWDSRANNNLRIGDKLYFTTGDISILDNDCTMVMFFNKRLISENDMESPYQLVKSGKWTIDTMFEMCNTLSADLNGDDKLKPNDDQYGLFCAFNVPHSLYFGTGERIVSGSADGSLTITMDTPRSAAAVDKILTNCLDKRNMTGDFEVSVKAFLEGRLLLAGWALVDISFIRNAEFDFGILPYPKLDEEQKEYSCLISTGLVPGVSIPITNQNPQKAGVILEALAQESVGTLTKSYYETALNDRYIRDTESSDMLDIIFASRVYDLGYIYDIGGLGSLIKDMYSAKKNTFESSFAKKQSAAQAALDELIGAFSAHE